MLLFNLVGVILLITQSGLCYTPFSNIPATSDDNIGELHIPVADKDNLLDENQNLDSDETVQTLINSGQMNIPLTRENFNIFNHDTTKFQLPPDDYNKKIDAIKKALDTYKEEGEINIKSDLLVKLLQTLPEGPLPIVYIEEDTTALDSDAGLVNKRSGRYYRRYPWKRQNSRYRTAQFNVVHEVSRKCAPMQKCYTHKDANKGSYKNSSYEPDNKYMCVPSRKDVMQLLLNIHNQRNGDRQKDVSFCNRKRPAKAVFTNIRFLG